MLAVIHGFLGRQNSGDDMMMWMHAELLARLGFTEIFLSTDGLSRTLIRNLERHAAAISTAYKVRCFVNKGWVAPDLLIVGGGALPPGFGFLQTCFGKIHGKTKVVYSSVTMPRRQGLEARFEEYQVFVGAFVDLIIVRDNSMAEWDLPYVQLPDIAGTYHPHQPKKLERTAVIFRHTERADRHMDVAPYSPFDVLVLSEADWDRSYAYARRYRVKCLNLSRRYPKQQIDELCRYSSVISFNRLHAAIYAQANGIPSVYIGETLLSNTTATGRLTMAEFEEYTTHFKAKAGIVDLVSPGGTLGAYGQVLRSIL